MDVDFDSMASTKLNSPKVLKMAFQSLFNNYLVKRQSSPYESGNLEQCIPEFLTCMTADYN